MLVEIMMVLDWVEVLGYSTLALLSMITMRPCSIYNINFFGVAKK